MLTPKLQAQHDRLSLLLQRLATAADALVEAESIVALQVNQLQEEGPREIAFIEDLVSAVSALTPMRNNANLLLSQLQDIRRDRFLGLPKDVRQPPS